jgi:hypothetical protein
MVSLRRGLWGFVAGYRRAPMIVASVLAVSSVGLVAVPGAAAARPSGQSRSASLPMAHKLHITYSATRPQLSAMDAQSLNERALRASHAGPRTPVDPRAPVRNGPAAPTVKAPPAAGPAGSSAAPTDFNAFVAKDQGAQSGLIPEPTEATNGNTVLMTWNTFDAVSSDGGVDWTFFNPATTFPNAFGGLCCDQSAIYVPQFDIYVLVLQYFADANSNNEIRIAVSQGAANLVAGNWFWYDYTPQGGVGALTGSNWDQPKISFDANFFFIESTSYGATGGSFLYRFPLQAMSIGAGCGCSFIGPFVEFSPGIVQGASQIMYFAAHRSTSVLRIFQWPDNSGSFFWNDINHTTYPENLPYTCPRTGGNSTSDWCQRRSFGGGWAHTDRIFNMWIANGNIGVAWDASQGSSGFGTFSYPYVQVELVKLTDLNGDGGARSPASEPYLSGNGFAVQYSAFSANALGGLGGAVEFGGGTSGIYESCSIVMWDQYQSGWNLMLGYYGNVDPNDTLSGDYLSSRGNGGNTRTWSSTCYNLQKANPTDTSTGSSHPLFLSFGRAQDNPFKTLTSSAIGSGNGLVYSSPPGILGCSSTCSANYIQGTTVNLSAFPNSDSTFGGWFGGCSGTACSVDMTANKTVYPDFIDIPPSAVVFTPTTLTGSVNVGFTETVNNVTTSNVVLRVAGSSTNLGGTLTCKNASGVVVSCATGAVASAHLQPTSPLVAGQHYSAIVDPSGLASSQLITDLQSSVVALTSSSFRASTFEQETSTGASYTWSTVTNASAAGGSYTTDELFGASASFAFNGTAITWYTVTGPTQGKATVYIDGVSKGTVDNSAATTSYQVQRTYSGLSTGNHTFKVVVNGVHGTNGTGTFIAVDAFRVGTTLYATPAAVYAWQHPGSTSASGGAYSDDDRANANTTFTFFGTGITWVSALGPDQGQADIYLDGALITHVDNYASTTHWQIGYAFGGLTNSQHTIRIQVAGTKNAASSGTSIIIDAFTVT